ncbi:MAG TPA: cation:proton antiporter, partial [Kiritimatiellia bacterium]|nr:cation:proton antiporter [Kiritimatiellia bacterium]
SFLIHNLGRLYKVGAAVGVAIVAVLLSRALIVGLTALGWNLFSRRENRITWPMQFIMLWGGLRGALPIALAVSIGAALVPPEEQTLIIQLTLGIILFTILVQGTTMKRFMRRFGMVGSDPPAAD